jgi:hypothetical protein
MKRTLLFTACLFLFSYAYAVEGTDSPFSVKHLKPTGNPISNPPFKFMHYYRTEVRNNLKRPIKIVWFEGYRKHAGKWYPGNVLGRALRGKEFSSWYTEGATTTNGVIKPGEIAVCDVNWHGTDHPEPALTKWAYIAVDDEGNDYFVEEEVPIAIMVSEQNTGTRKLDSALD